MSARSVREWVGKTPDTKPPPRVRLRIFQRENGMCHISGRKISPGEEWQADHKIALINGGENRESNLFPALVDKHAEKTKADMAEKSRIADLAKGHFGARRQAPPREPDTSLQSRKRPKHEGRGPAIGAPQIARLYVEKT